MFPATAGCIADSTDEMGWNASNSAQPLQINTDTEECSESSSKTQVLKHFTAPPARDRKPLLSAIPPNHPARFLMIGVALTSQDMASAAKAYDKLYAAFQEYYRVRNRRPPTQAQLDAERYPQRKGVARV